MEVLRNLLIRPHSGLYEYGSANFGAPLPFYAWPSVTVSFVGVYLLTVKLILPRLMLNREPCNLRAFMLVYNAVQVVTNLCMAVVALGEMLRQGDIILTGCLTPTPLLIHLNLLWILNKYADLSETAVFVLRHKSAQVSFLHVYHHVIVIYCSHMTFVEQPGGLHMFSCVLNMLVHALMYAYYFASIYDREWASRWRVHKKRITQVQMVQFCVNMLFYVRIAAVGCEFPRYLSWSLAAQNVVLFALFGNFYYLAYHKRVATGKRD